MRVAVTGGTGFLGSHVVEALVQAGHDPVCMVRPTSDTHLLDDLGVATVVSRLDDLTSLAALVRDADAVIHLAGLVKARNRREFDLANGQGTAHLADAAADADVDRFTLVSSIAAKGPSPTPEPAPAGLATSPVSHYGMSKAAGEQEALHRTDDLSVRIVRPPVVYGPRDVALLDLFRAVRRGVFPEAGPKGAMVSTVYAPDCADCIVRATEVDVDGPMVVEPADGPPHPWDEFRDCVADAVDRESVRNLRTPTALVSMVATINQLALGMMGRAPKVGRDKVRELRHAYWLADGESAKRHLDWTPTVDLAEGTGLTATWYRRAGWM